MLHSLAGALGALSLASALLPFDASSSSSSSSSSNASGFPLASFRYTDAVARENPLSHRKQQQQQQSHDGRSSDVDNDNGHGGGGGDGTLSLVLFDDAVVEQYAAKCLDGSPAGYYLRESASNSTDWVIFLKGGGLCVEPIDCLARVRVWARAGVV
jgi:hypothetical protein